MINLNIPPAPFKGGFDWTYNGFHLIVKLISIILFSISANAMFAQGPKADSLEIGIIEHLNEYIPEHIMLINENKDTVDLKKIINKPTVLCFVYFECPMLCSPLMNGLADVIDKTNLKIGKDYQVLTIGFNTEEPLSLAISKKKNYVSHMKTKEAANAWNFFISDSINITRATNALGFRFKRAGNVFLHSATLIFISPEGKITRYLNGTYFLPFEFKMAIAESSKGISGPTINKLLQYCYGYDTQAKRYVLDITKVGGGIILLILLAIVFPLIIRPRLRAKIKDKNATEPQH
jgi:protein SCO1